MASRAKRAASFSCSKCRRRARHNRLVVRTSPPGERPIRHLCFQCLPADLVAALDPITKSLITKALEAKEDYMVEFHKSYEFFPGAAKKYEFMTKSGRRKGQGRPNKGRLRKRQDLTLGSS